MPLYEGVCLSCGDEDEHLSKPRKVGDQIATCTRDYNDSPCGGVVVRTSTIHSISLVGPTPTNGFQHGKTFIDSASKEREAVEASGGRTQFIRKGSEEESSLLRKLEATEEGYAAKHGFSSADARRRVTKIESDKKRGETP
jgi:hypothetical protein